jgi:hypothetical protein
MNTIKRLYLFLGLIGLLALPLSALAQGGNGISSPRDNAEVSGVVLIEGTATDPNFLRYELSFFKEFDPMGEWVVFATGDRPVSNGVLASWDTTVGRDAGAPFYPDGTYRLRLRVVRQDSNYDEYYVLGLSLSNETPTETPTPTPGGEGEGVTPAPTSAVVIPTELPTLTPFPTNTPRPTTVAGAESSDEGGDTVAEPSGSLFDLEGEFNTARIKEGLVFGVQLALTFFVLLGLYVIGRRVLREILRRSNISHLPDRLREWLSK